MVFRWWQAATVAIIYDLHHWAIMDVFRLSNAEGIKVFCSPCLNGSI